MSLSTGASLITLSLLLNKLSGLYGILALFTGYHLSPFQLSMYIYSILGLLLTVCLAPHIRTRSPLHCIALAWFYCLDSIINAAYTAAFAVTWFLVLAQHNAGKSPSDSKAPGAGTIDDTSGFTNPQVNASSMDIIDSSPASPNNPQKNVEINHTPSGSPAGVGDGTLSNAVLSTESLNSIGVIIALWTIRLYFCVIMLGYARFVLRQHVSLSSTGPDTSYTSASPSSDLADNPFARDKPEGQGWRGKLGRIMVAVAPRFWLGSDEDDSWMAGMGGKFRKSTETGGIALGQVESGGAGGPAERERRRRSGTGPPEPDVQLLAQQTQQTQPQQQQVGDVKGANLSVPLQKL